MIRAIAFDFDGVLCESVDVKTEAFRRLFSDESPDHLEAILHYHRQNGGVSRFEKFRWIYKEILCRHLDEARFEALCSEFARLVIDAVVASPWVEGTPEFLENHTAAFNYFVVSATPDAEIKEIVRRKGSERWFREIFGSPRSKEILLKELMEKYELSAHEIVYVGDAPNDWEAARRAGTYFIWRQLGIEAPELSGYRGPVIRTLRDLPKKLEAVS